MAIRAISGADIISDAVGAFQLLLLLLLLLLLPSFYSKTNEALALVSPLYDAIPFLWFLMHSDQVLFFFFGSLSSLAIVVNVAGKK